MDKKTVVVCAVILALSSFGSAYGDVGWNYPPFQLVLGSGNVDRDAFGIAFFLDPETLLTIGYMGLEVSTGPGLGLAIGAQSGYIVETQTTATGTQTTYVSGTQIAYASGDGIALVDSDMHVVIVQSQP